MAANTTSDLSGNTTISNPYPGPVPFNQKYSQFFFGREGEKIELTSMVVANRVVFLYAQSGAGKTSLLNASLLPSLAAEGFDMLPVVRPGIPMPKDISPSEVKNIFAFNTLRAWTKDADPRSLLTKNVADFLTEDFASKWAKLPKKETRPPARIIVLDQFEEIFTTYAERWKDREEFFLQLADVLDPDPDDWKETVKRLKLTGLISEPDRTIRILFVLREDYLASLHSYADLLPIRPAALVRIERLRKSAACEAVENPAKLIGKPFVKGVACGLVEKLLENRVEVVGGEATPVEGEFVEPVQLQIVCKKLLESLPPGKQQIDSGDIEKLGDVNEPLAGFYDEAVREAAKESGEKESALRDWFEYSLITPAGTRGTVFRDKETQRAAGIMIEAVELLDRSHLVRGEMRAGGLWYELTHDRFIEPILLANKRWRDARSDETKRRLESKAAEWSASGADKSKLLKEAELKEAERWITTLEAKELGYSPILVAFIQASRAELDRKKTRNLRRAAMALAVLIVIAAGTTVWAFDKSKDEQRAKEALQEVNKELKKANEDLDDANKKLKDENILTGEERVKAEAAKDLAEMRRKEAEIATDLAEKRRIEAVDAKDLAESRRIEAEAAKDLAETRRLEAEAAKDLAEKRRIEAEDAKDLAEKRKIEAERLSRISQARAFAAQSRSKDDDDPSKDIRRQDDPLDNVDLVINAISITSAGDKNEGDKNEKPGKKEPEKIVVKDAMIAIRAILPGALLEPFPLRNDYPDLKPEARITSVGFGQTGTSPALFAVTASGGFTGWDTESDKFSDPPARPRFSQSEKASNATLSPDGKLAAFAIRQNVGSEKEDKIAKKVKIFDLTGNAAPIIVDGHARGVNKFAFSDALSGGRRYLATTNNFGNYKVTEINFNGKSKEKWAKPNLMEKLRVRFGDQLRFLGIKGDQFRLANALAFSHNSGNNEKLLLATGFQDGRVAIRDAESGGNDSLLPEGSHSDSILAMGFSQDNKYLVVSSRDNKLIAWPMGSEAGKQTLASQKKQTGKNERQSIEIHNQVRASRFGGIKHQNPVTSIAFSKDGKYMATGSEDRTVIIWKVKEIIQEKDREIVREFVPVVKLPDHNAQITELGFSHDSQQLATVAADNRRRIWDISSLPKLQELMEKLNKAYNSRSFRRDGTADVVQIETNSGIKIDSLIQELRDFLEKPKKKN